MKNIPRIFVGDNISENTIVPIGRDVAHYLGKVMRTKQCLAFGGGREFNATLGEDGKALNIGAQTTHPDPSNDITLMFAPIKRADDLINMAVQMGVGTLQPVITERTIAHHINWERMRKIAIEAAEQSNRNSVPEIMSPIKLSQVDMAAIAFADERAAYGHATKEIDSKIKKILIGPEGGFSDSEFEMLDGAGAHGISLGRTILRAEVAAVVALGKIIK